MLSGGCDKVRQLMRAIFQIFEIKHALGESPKKPRHSIFEHFAARAEQSGIRVKLASQRNEIALVSACAVQEQQRAL